MWELDIKVFGDKMVGYREEECKAIAQQEVPRVGAVGHLCEDVEAVDDADNECCDAELRTECSELLGVYYLGRECYKEQYARNKCQNIC